MMGLLADGANAGGGREEETCLSMHCVAGMHITPFSNANKSSVLYTGQQRCGDGFAFGRTLSVGVGGERPQQAVSIYTLRCWNAHYALL